jgi:hypothetical protein
VLVLGVFVAGCARSAEPPATPKRAGDVSGFCETFSGPHPGRYLEADGGWLVVTGQARVSAREDPSTLEEIRDTLAAPIDSGRAVVEPRDGEPSPGHRGR